MPHLMRYRKDGGAILGGIAYVASRLQRAVKIIPLGWRGAGVG